jgi:hypothetical protein
MARKRRQAKERRLPSGDIEKIRPGLVRVTRYRDKRTGKFTSKPRRMTKRYGRELYEYRVKAMGEFTTGRIVSTEDTETKKVGTIDLAQWEGSVKSAMQASNVFSTVQRRNARMVDIFVQGYDGKTRVKIKKSLDLRDIKKRYEIGDMMTGKIIERLHSMGYRTQYELDVIRWSGKQTRKREAASYKPLKNASISFRIRY